MARGVRRRTPTPRAVGNVERVTPEEPTQDQMQMILSEAERRDAEAISKSLTGQDFGKTLGIIPYKVTDPEAYGKTFYGDQFKDICSYCRKGNIKHVHAPYIGVGVINEIARVYKGISRKVLSRQRVHRDSGYGWESTAAAFDIVTKSYTEATVFHSPKKGENPDFTPRIADTMAKRNAMKEILPQFFMERLKEMAMDGTRELTQKMAEALIQSFGDNRAKLMEKYDMLTLGQLTPSMPLQQGNGAPALSAGAEPSAEPRRQPTPSTPPPRTPTTKPVAPSPSASKPAATPPPKGEVPPADPPRAERPQGETNRARITAWKKREGIELVDAQFDPWWKSKFGKLPEQMTQEEMDAAGKQLVQAYEGFGKTPEERRRTLADICIYETDRTAKADRDVGGNLPLG